MKYHNNKSFGLFFFFFLLGLSLSAQQNHFIYLQTENRQPFFVRMESRLLSSSVTGYLIIPKLSEGSYALTIGFPRNEWPEQNVTCVVNKKDVGYLLKRFGDKGWGLFDLQTMGVLMLSGTKTETGTAEELDKNDIFSNTLSGVVNDPSVIKKLEPKIIKEEAKPVVVKEDTVAAVAIVPKAAEALEEKKIITTTVPVKPVASDAVTTVIKAPETPIAREEVAPALKMEKKPEEEKLVVKQEVKTVTRKEPAQISVGGVTQVKKLFSFKSSEGTDMVYIDLVNGVPDTVRLFVPADKNLVVQKEEKKMPEKEVPKTTPVQEEAKPVPVVTLLPEKEVPKTTPVQEEAKPVPVVTLLPEKKKETPVPVVTLLPEKKKDEPVKKVSKKEAAKTAAAKGKEAKFIDLELPNPNARDTAVKVVVVEKQAQEKKGDSTKTATVTKPLIFNSDCKGLASEGDFIKLRKKMAAETVDDDMIAVARKAFKSKCYSTEQVKNLGVLFLKEEGRYRFFDLAYAFVSDSYNYAALENQFKDDYFITRFKAMLRH